MVCSGLDDTKKHPPALQNPGVSIEPAWFGLGTATTGWLFTISQQRPLPVAIKPDPAPNQYRITFSFFLFLP